MECFHKVEHNWEKEQVLVEEWGVLLVEERKTKKISFVKALIRLKYLLYETFVGPKVRLSYIYFTASPVLSIS